MDIINNFHSLNELIKALDREKELLQSMFQERKLISFKYEVARELAKSKDDSLDFLRKYGVIRYNDDGVELEEVYLKFFEEVLVVNEDINVASVKESIDSLVSSIEYYQSENKLLRKQNYLRDVRRTLHTIALNSLRNVIDLKRNIDNTYKNEPTFAVKLKKLKKLDEKRKDIASLIVSCEDVINHKHRAFFIEAMDNLLHETVNDVKLQLKEAYHNLIELDKQIITYLNLIEYQNRLFLKIQKLKYLRDQMTLQSDTDILARLDRMNPVWIEPRPKYTLKVSLETLRNKDIGLQILKEIKFNKNDRLRKGNLAVPFTSDELSTQEKVIPFIDTSDIKNAFLASSDDLFHYIMNYSGYPKPMVEEEKLVLFCQVAAQYLDELHILDEYKTSGNISYPLIYSKQKA